MAIPPIPKPGSFLERIKTTTPDKPPRAETTAIAVPPPAAVVVSRKRNRELAPWMVVTAAEAFKAGGTIKTVAALLNVTEARLSGWIDASEAEDAEDELLLEFGHVCRQGRAGWVGKLRRAVEIHALTDGKIAMALLQAYDPEMNPTKKVEAKIKVEGPSPESMDNLDVEDIRALRAIEKKRLGGR